MIVPQVCHWGATGDKVALYTQPNMGPAQVEFAEIIRVTATQVVVTGVRRFRRADGYSWGNRYGPQLKRPEEREVQDAVAAQAIRELGIPLNKEIKGVRSRDDALQALHRLNRLLRETADKLGVNHADLA